MPALTNARHITVPAQQTPSSARGRWHEPTPAEREWMAGVGHPKLLHRIQRWERSPGGLMYARCGARSYLWMSLSAWAGANRARCLNCEDVDDAQKRLSIELDVDAVGPELRYATAKVNKVSRGSATQSSSATADPWAGAPGAAADDDPEAPF